MTIQYKTKGVCSKQMNVSLDDDGVVRAVEIIGGCHGNGQGVARLVEGMKARDAIDKMVDHSGDPATEAAVRACVEEHDDVCRVDVLRTREFGNRLYVELEIAVDGDLTLHEAHAVAEGVHDDVEKAFPQVKHIMVHVNPARPAPPSGRAGSPEK